MLNYYKNQHALYESALAKDSDVFSNNYIEKWLAERRNAIKFNVNIIGLNELDKWKVSKETGNFHHDSGGFFSISGIEVESDQGQVKKWSQPIIDQREVGLLGVLCKSINGTIHFLMQAKHEPGNINQVQLSPTVQATMSNINQKHKGKKPPYSSYFQNINKKEILIDQLQSEQGNRFYKKRNRNIIIKLNEDIDLIDGFIWMTYGQIKNLLKVDNLINMDTRSVFSCINFFGSEISNNLSTIKSSSLFTRSFTDEPNSSNLFDETLSWISELKSKSLFSTRLINLNSLTDWIYDGDVIKHKNSKYFTIVGVRSSIEGREIHQWDQPMYKPEQDGVLGLIVKPIDGILNILIQAKTEAGNMDLLELAPTVQTLTGSYKEDLEVPFLWDILNAPKEKLISSSKQSEEGGRFFKESNYNYIVLEDQNYNPILPKNYKWIPLNQILYLLKFNNYLNMSARSLISLMPID